LLRWLCNHDPNPDPKDFLDPLLKRFKDYVENYADKALKKAHKFSSLVRLEFAAEIFPMVGILGTCLGLMATLTAIGAQEKGGIMDMSTLAREFGPALSTTVLGILGALTSLAVNRILDVDSD